MRNLLLSGTSVAAAQSAHSCNCKTTQMQIQKQDDKRGARGSKYKISSDERVCIMTSSMMPSLPFLPSLLHGLVIRNVTATATNATTSQALHVVCAFPLSGQYGPGNSSPLQHSRPDTVLINEISRLPGAVCIPLLSFTSPPAN